MFTTWTAVHYSGGSVSSSTGAREPPTSRRESFSVDNFGYRGWESNCNQYCSCNIEEQSLPCSPPGAPRVLSPSPDIRLSQPALERRPWRRAEGGDGEVRAKGGGPGRGWQCCSFLMTTREWRKDNDNVCFLRNVKCEEAIIHLRTNWKKWNKSRSRLALNVKPRKTRKYQNINVKRHKQTITQRGGHKVYYMRVQPKHIVYY